MGATLYLLYELHVSPWVKYIYVRKVQYTYGLHVGATFWPFELQENQTVLLATVHNYVKALMVKLKFI